MSVTIAEPLPYFLDLETSVEGVPHVVITVLNVPYGGVITIERSSGGDTMTVQGARNRFVNEAEVFRDWAAPLNRESTYSVVVDGVVVSSATVTLFSETAWLQNPLHPEIAIPVSWKNFAPGALLLQGSALKKVDYPAEFQQMRPMGSRYPVVVAGQRQGGSGVEVPFWSDEREVADGFRDMVLDAPILLLRPLPEHVPLPPVCYLAAQVTEQPVTVHYGRELTSWAVTGDLVRAVVQASLSGDVTYEQVNGLLAGYTYAEIQARAGATTYLDWRKNPMIFTRL